MNLFDLLKQFFCWLGRCFMKLFRFCGKILQLTYRNGWLIAAITLTGIIGGYIYSRPNNRVYNAEALAQLNGPTANITKEAVRQLEFMFPKHISEPISTANLLNLPDSVAKTIRRIESFYVIDFLNDSTPDMVDFKNNHSLEDTLNVRSQQYLYFRIRIKDVNQMPQIETALLNYLNSNANIQAQHINYKENLLGQINFCNSQLQRLDSLETLTYFQSKPLPQLQIDRWASSMLIGEQRTQLLHEDMQALVSQRTKLKEQLVTCTAPVILPSHFVISSKAVNSRMKCCLYGLIGGYVLGLVIALIAEQLKNILAFLRKR